MRTTYKIIIVVSLTLFLASFPMVSTAQDLSDYTAYPPFATNAVEPNILLVLDHSGSMQFPAYTGCDWGGYSSSRANCGDSDSSTNPEYNYNPTRDYYGYFEIDTYYQYVTNKFVENPSCSFAPGDTEYRVGNNAGCTSGNLLNWATMSRTDILRKALIGGKSVATQDTDGDGDVDIHTLRSEGGWREFTDETLGCTFDITGGTYPALDHELTITDSGGGFTGTCGYLSVWANGSSMWDTRDRFRYVYQSISGNFDVRLRIVTPPTESGNTFAKAGLVVRKNTNSRSEHVKAMATFGSGLQFSDRRTYGGNTNQVGGYVAISYPVWVRIIRSGNTFTYYYSSDGSAWTMQGSSTFNLPPDLLIGMGTTSYSNGTLGKAEYDEFICDVCSSDNFDDGFFNTGIWSATEISTNRTGSQVESCGQGCPISALTNANIQVDVPASARSGVIQTVSDKDGDGNFDTNSPRFGFMSYASDRKGCMRVGVAGSSMSSLLSAIEGEVAYNGTPTGEALNEAWDYFIQSNDHSGCNNSTFIGGTGSTEDPMYDSGTAVPCRKNYGLLISDGEWNGSVDPVVPAREAHINDIRPDISAGFQNMNNFSVYIFGDDSAGESSMQQTAMYGGFDDEDNNNWPYDRTGYPADSRAALLPAAPCDPLGTMDDKCKEWDDNLDGLPDNYYKGNEGDKLEIALVKAITDILKRSSSGSAVSVLATTAEGDGAVYQAYFFPNKLDGFESRKWLGYVQSLFVDKYGNLREDTNGNKALDMATDLIIQMGYDPEKGTEVYKCSDSNGDGIKESCAPPVYDLDVIKAVWRGGKSLWQRSPASRAVFTTLDGFTELDFKTAQASTLMPYLRAGDNTESENIINWIRGDDMPGIIDVGHPEGYRERSITINSLTNTWKLGDIINSTPTVVGRPMENYHLLYGDPSYSKYRTAHVNRRQVVYVGANDGMLHAFNGGCFNSADLTFYPDVDINGHCTSGSHTLGQELWGFIPRGLLPHLKWTTDPDYTHVYYVDSKPKVTDIRVFTAGGVHTGGWGTILIGSFRYGGKEITCPAPCNSASPEYFALDITDPLSPRLLWTFSDPELGLSMSYPAVAKVGGKWFAIFGSGPTDFNTNSNLLAYQDGNIFVLDISSGSNGTVTSWSEGSNFWKIPTLNTTAFLSNPITVDVDIDYDVDVMYIGENYQQVSGDWNARLKRITTSEGNEDDPGEWKLSTIADVNAIANTKDVVKRITSAPTAGVDEKGNLYTFFGTGQFYGSADKNHTDTGAFYAIKDGCWDGSCTLSYTSLLDVSDASITTGGSVSGIGGACGVSSNWGNLLDATNYCDGWVMYFQNLGEQTDFTGEDLSHNGERVTSKPLVLGGLVTWTTYIPGIDECDYEGESNIYAVYYKTGTAYKNYVFREQKEQAAPSNVVARVKKLGSGMPSSVSAQITSTGTTKGFAQQSTGSILGIESINPISLKSEVKGWQSERIP